MKQKKAITLLLAATMALSLLSGCSSNEPQGKPQPAPPLVNNEEPKAPTEKQEEQRMVSENLERLAIDLEGAGYQVYAGITDEEGAVFIAERGTLMINHYLEADKRTIIIKTDGTPDEKMDKEIALALDRIYPNQGQVLTQWYVDAQAKLEPDNPKQLITEDLDGSFTLSLSKVEQETTFTVVPKK